MHEKNKVNNPIEVNHVLASLKESKKEIACETKREKMVTSGSRFSTYPPLRKENRASSDCFLTSNLLEAIKSENSITYSPVH